MSDSVSATSPIQDGGGVEERSARVARIISEVTHRRLAGESVPDEEVLRAHAGMRAELAESLYHLCRVEEARIVARAGGSPPPKPADPNLANLDGSDDMFVPACASSSRSVSHPESIGEYAILGVLGCGGMGVVYRAKPRRLPRLVALKTVRADNLSPQVLRRFEREAEILSRLQHPGIAQIYEAGLTSGGEAPQPFFAMELVDGVPIIRYAHNHSLGHAERLELLAKVCDAVAFAHQNGVIHRDLKPSNILIDPSGQPKVLDFGVARVTTSDDHATTMHTDVGQLIGTIPYMSPEQVTLAGREMDTRTDVFSLGVLGYELLTGQLPFDVRNKSIPQCVRSICEDEPVRLSALQHFFRGDLDTIFAKALEKDRNRRYASAADLAADIRRHLNHEPISVHPPSTLYQLRKFARRHRGLMVAVGCTFLALVLGIAGTTRGLLQARRAERRAQSEAAKAQEVNKFLRDLLSAPDPAKRGRSVSIAELLDAAAANIDSQFHDPDVRGELHGTVSDTYHALGLYEESEQHARSALTIVESLHGPTAANTLTARTRLGNVLGDAGKHTEAQPLLEETLRLARETLGATHLETINAMEELGYLLAVRQWKQEGTLMLSEALRLRRENFPDDRERLARTIERTGGALELGNRHPEAEAHYREAAAIYRELHGPGSIAEVALQGNLAVVLGYQNKDDEVEQLYLNAIPQLKKRYGDEHPFLAPLVHNLAIFYLLRDRLDEAEPVFREALAIHRKGLGDHQETWVTMYNFSGFLGNLRQNYLEAIALIQEAHEMRIRLYGPSDSLLAATLWRWGTWLEATGEEGAAEEKWLESLRIHREAETKWWDVSPSAYALAALYVRQSRSVEAEPLIEQAMAAFRGNPKNTHPDAMRSELKLARAFLACGRVEEARLLFEALKEKRNSARNEQFRAQISEAVTEFERVAGDAEPADADESAP